jgi:hypothetical protein
MISSFCHKVDEDCALLGYYTVSSINSIPTFQDDLLVKNLSAVPDVITNLNFTDYQKYLEMLLDAAG